MQNTNNKLQENLQQAMRELPWWTHQITLLLDGINVPNILPLLYAGSAIQQFDVLYLQTPFQELKDVSPCLIKLESPSSYPVQRLLDNLNDEWGYILASQEPWQSQVDHLRNLLVVKDFETSKKMLLKIADPQVITALLKESILRQDPVLFGPFSQILSYDIIDQTVINLQKPNGSMEQFNLPYQLTEQESQALDQVDIKRANQQIYAHMHQYFPEFMNNQENSRNFVDHLIEEAEKKGYISIQEQLYYLNIHGYLGKTALENEQIATLIQKRDIESLKEAAQLAQQLAE